MNKGASPGAARTWQTYGKPALAAATWSQTFEMTTDPSPTAEATRLTEPARTSPTAKMPGQEVAWLASVSTKPLASRSTSPASQPVLGAACAAEGLDLERDDEIGVHLDGLKGVGVARLEVLEGPSGRRRRTKAERARVAAESMMPELTVAAIARNHGTARWQIYD